MPLILLFESDETGLRIFCQDDAFQIVDRNLILILILQKMVIVVSTQAGCLLTMVFCVFKEGYENGNGNILEFPKNDFKFPDKMQFPGGRKSS